MGILAWLFKLEPLHIVQLQLNKHSKGGLLKVFVAASLGRHWEAGIPRRHAANQQPMAREPATCLQTTF